MQYFPAWSSSATVKAKHIKAYLFCLPRTHVEGNPAALGSAETQHERSNGMIPGYIQLHLSKQQLLAAWGHATSIACRKLKSRGFPRTNIRSIKFDGP